MKTPVFKGSCTALISPFTENGIDFERMGEQLRFQEKNGTQAVLVAGTTGENATLEIHEYDALVDFCIQKVAGAMKIIVGIGGNNTKECCRKAKRAEELGADALLMTPPYYNKTTQTGVVEHFYRAADAAGIPLILYNVPGRTVIGISIDSYEKLSKHQNINGVKEASGDFSLISKIASRCGHELNIWSGNDDNTLPMMAMGAVGTISVASNIIPGEIAKLCELCLNGKYEEALKLHICYANLFEKLFIETNPIPVKAAMKYLGMDSGILRMPLMSISNNAREILYNAMDSMPLKNILE